MAKNLMPIESVAQAIRTIRGQRVILDEDVAKLYGVSTKALNRAVKRNVERFPMDFMFVLTQQEFINLKYQIGTSSWGGRRKLPYAFTEHGAAMLASVLNGSTAVEVSVMIVRAFVELRRAVIDYKDIMARFEALERQAESHGEAIKVLLAAVRQLTIVPDPPKKRIGFTPAPDG